MDADAEKSKLDRYVILPAALLASQRSAGKGLPDSTAEIVGVVLATAVVFGVDGTGLPGATALPLAVVGGCAPLLSLQAAITTNGNSNIATRCIGMRTSRRDGARRLCMVMLPTSGLRRTGPGRCRRPRRRGGRCAR